ncbi:MAG: hypothetical protein JWP31_773, partial [Aeromicrobium sp.]|nr:hypothetical protein [Aeromicrobium sp.]
MNRWWAYSLVGALVVLVYPFVSSDGATDVIDLGVVLSCVAAMIVGI